MRTRSLPEYRPTLQEVQQQFKIWRSNSRKRRPIPQELWDAAVNLCDKHSISKVAIALRLNHTDLKKRIKSPTQRNCSESPPAFIEVEIPSGATATGEWTMELEDGGGRKMRLSWKGERDLDVSSLAQGFWALPG